MPIPGAFIPGGDWREAVITLPLQQGMSLAVGGFGVVIDFLIVSVVIFLIARYARRMGLK